MTEQEIKDRIANNICLECGKPITDDTKFFCKDCLGKSKEHFSQKVFGREYKEEEDDWTWVFGLMMVASLFDFGGDKNDDGN